MARLYPFRTNVEYNLNYDPSESAREAINTIYDRQFRMQQTVSRNYSYFNDRNLISYIDDSTKRWNGYIPPRDDLVMDWQARVFNNFTRNVTIAFLSKVALQKPKAKIIATNKEGSEDSLRAHILSKMFEYTKNLENGNMKFFNASLECVTKGTIVAYEGYKKVKRKIREIKQYDPLTGQYKTEEKEILDYNDCYQQIIPLEDLYVANIWTPDIQQQPDIIWRSLVRKSEAEEEFRKYPGWKYVLPGAYTTIIEQTSFYKNKKIDLEIDQVEILRYFNRLKDQMRILANGVLLYDGPIPFNHKKYPFAKTVFEPMAIDFFYGKSLPAKIESDQDVINTLWNMMLDQSYLSIFKPILTDDPDEVEDTVLVPGLIQKVGDINKYRVLNELQGPDNTHFNMLQMAMNFAKDNSGSMLGGGPTFSPKGGKVTARQAMMQEEQARQILGLNVKLLESFERDATELRCKNILQFSTLPEKIEDITGQGGFKQLFTKTIRVDDTELSDGTYGTAIVKMGQSEQELPQENDIAVEEEMASLQGNNTEIIAITAEYIRNMDIDVQIVGESSYMQAKSLNQAMGLEFYQMMSQNPLINQEENTRDAIELYDKDPDRFIIKQQEQGVPAMAGKSQAMPQATSQVLEKKKTLSLDNIMSQ